MTKFLVDDMTHKIRGAYDEPLNFSVAGRYVIDIPAGTMVRADTDSVTDLLALKINALKASHPDLPDVINDELLATSLVETSPPGDGASLFTTGPYKRTSIAPGGTIVTRQLTLANSCSQIFVHVCGFMLSSYPGQPSSTPEPSRLLYNYDVSTEAHVDFEPSFLLTEVRDSGNTSTVLTVTPDTEMDFVQLGGYSFRLRFTNQDTRTWYLSDWLILTG